MLLRQSGIVSRFMSTVIGIHTKQKKNGCPHFIFIPFRGIRTQLFQFNFHKIVRKSHYAQQALWEQPSRTMDCQKHHRDPQPTNPRYIPSSVEFIVRQWLGIIANLAKPATTTQMQSKHPAVMCMLISLLYDCRCDDVH